MIVRNLTLKKRTIKGIRVMRLMLFALADPVITATIAHHQIVSIAKKFTQIYSIALLIGIRVAHNLNPNLAMSLTDNIDVKGAGKKYRR